MASFDFITRHFKQPPLLWLGQHLVFTAQSKPFPGVALLTEPDKMSMRAWPQLSMTELGMPPIQKSS